MIYYGQPGFITFCRENPEHLRRRYTNTNKNHSAACAQAVLQPLVNALCVLARLLVPAATVHAAAQMDRPFLVGAQNYSLREIAQLVFADFAFCHIYPLSWL
jgi:hypothetical protein